jgi:hypothetical protein
MGRLVLGSSRLSTARVFVFAPVEGLILEGVPADYSRALLYSHYTSKRLKGGSPKQLQTTSPTNAGRGRSAINQEGATTRTRKLLPQ